MKKGKILLAYYGKDISDPVDLEHIEALLN
jgi:hypothetical protein